MAFIDDVKKAFKVPENHEPKVILVGATDKANFDMVWARHDLEQETKDMDENASKHGMSWSPVFIVLMEGNGGHLDVEITLPLQSWSDNLRVETALLETKDLQRITDWLAGFMEPFCMNDSISALEVATGMLTFGSANDTVFNMDNVMKSIRPKKDKGELMSDALDIGSVDDILSGQLSTKEVEAMTRKPVEEKAAIAEAVEQIEAGAQVKDIAPQIAYVIDGNDKKTQQDILDKYGFKALQELLDRTGKPLLVKKPKAKKV